MRYVNVSPDTRFVTHGFSGVRKVDPGEVLEVPDEVAAAYDQPGIWEAAAAPSSTPTASPASTAAPAEVDPPTAPADSAGITEE